MFISVTLVYTHRDILITGQLLMSAHTHIHIQMHTSYWIVTDMYTHTYIHKHTHTHDWKSYLSGLPWLHINV